MSQSVMCKLKDSDKFRYKGVAGGKDDGNEIWNPLADSTLSVPFNPSHSNINVVILYTVPYIFPVAMTRGIDLTSKIFFRWPSFLLFS